MIKLFPCNINYNSLMKIYDKILNYDYDSLKENLGTESKIAEYDENIINYYIQNPSNELLFYLKDRNLPYFDKNAIAIIKNSLDIPVHRGINIACGLSSYLLECINSSMHIDDAISNEYLYYVDSWKCDCYRKNCDILFKTKNSVSQRLSSK